MSPLTIRARTGSGARAQLLAYSSFEPYELVDYLEALADRFPDVAITIERLPTAALTARLLAERPRPAADLVFGWADTASQTPGLEGLIIRRDAGRDGYIRPSGFSTAFVADPAVLAQADAEIASWRDLADPRLAGRLVFPDPSISGAGFLALATLLQFYGEDEGWDLLRAINRNVREHPNSAWGAADACGDGVVACGVTVRIAAGKRLQQEPTLRVVEPADVIGAEAEVYGPLCGARRPEVVEEIVGWVLSDEARALFDHHNKTNLCTPVEGLFMVDATSAIARRAQWLARFKTLATF
jgi:iron(III) transport system substrate-binding protein